MKLKIIFIFSFLFTMICCEVETDDAKKAYEYWSGERPDKNLNIEYGKYWRSPHWSYEYKFYLKFKPSESGFTPQKIVFNIKLMKSLIKVQDITEIL